MQDTLEADLVVVGYGSAGAAAATRAADLGASVVIVEKQPQKTHRPSSRMAHIVMSVDDVEKAVPYFDRCAGGMVPLAVSRAWVERAHALPAWLEKAAGLRLEYVRGAQHPDFAGAEALSVSLAVPVDSKVKVERKKYAYGVPFAPGSPIPRNEEFMEALEAAVQRRGVTVLYDSPAQRLIRGADGRVNAVEVGGPAGTRRITARKGVVLSCGGYEYDEDLKLNYLKAYPIHFYGTHANTGDGVRMAQAVGADLWHMNQMLGRAIGHFEMDGEPVNTIVRMDPPGYVITDKYGRRFADEYKNAEIIKHTFYFELMYNDPETRDYPRIPCYWFFDSSRMGAGALSIGQTSSGYTWTADNRAELGRGWIHEGATIAAAAKAAGVRDPEEAQRSVDDYNRACERGEDRFHRPKDTLVPLAKGPFYCVPLFPGGPNTCGGPRRDEKARILDPFGMPIPGLFGAGELGEPIGALYPSSGSNLSEALCFGQIAAETAVQGG